MSTYERYERAASALAAGKSVVAEGVRPKQWLRNLRSQLIVDHSDPGDFVTWEVHVTYRSGKYIARARLVYIERD